MVSEKSDSVKMHELVSLKNNYNQILQGEYTSKTTTQFNKPVLHYYQHH